jgi:hypothetical protein
MATLTPSRRASVAEAGFSPKPKRKVAVSDNVHETVDPTHTPTNNPTAMRKHRKHRKKKHKHRRTPSRR